MLEQNDWLQTELDELTSSPEDSPARTSALREDEKVCLVSAAACGPSFTELSLKFDPVGQSLRMSLGLELSAQTQCSLTWQEQLTPLGRWWWVLSMPELPTDGSGFGLLPTPTVSSGAQTKENPTPGQTGGTTLEGWARMLPTPTARDCKGVDAPGREGGSSLPQAILDGTGEKRLSPCFVEWMMGYPAGWTDVSD